MISSLTPVTTAVPLIGVLALSAVKDAYDDIVSILGTIKQRILCKEKDAKKATKNIATKSPILHLFWRKIASIMKWKKISDIFFSN